MTNREIALVLFNISTILKGANGNPYRIRAYRNAARALLRLPHQVAERVARGEPLGIPRLGERLTAKISELAASGGSVFYDALCDELLPPEERALVKIPGIGPTIAARIHADLGSTDAESLRRAARSGTLQQVWGLGPQRVAAILEACDAQPMVQQRLDLDRAA